MHVALIASLAARDWWHERLLSLCAVLALASMLAPLLVLHGVRVGLVDSLRANLLQDPTALIILPVGSGTSGYTQAQLDQWRARPEVRFAIARTRDVAAEMPFISKNGTFVPLMLEPSAAGDPLLEHFHMPVPTDGLKGALADGSSIRGNDARPGMVLSATAARKLDAKTGDVLEGRLGRKRPDGGLERQDFSATVLGVLPPEATPQDAAFVPLSVLEDIQDYRDYVAVPRRGYSGDPAPQNARRYESFRMYARDLDSVEILDRLLASQNIQVVTKAKNIADIRKIDTAITQLLLVIALAVGTGFLAFTLSSALAAVRRKDKMLGMLRLLGFSRASLLCYPLSQTLLTGAGGTLAAGGIALGVAAGIDAIFAAHVMNQSICVVRVQDVLTALAAVLVLSTLAALYPALRAAAVDPALVVRDV